ncbi:hypothetical protein [Flavobacterium sp.]|uniref:hypothetical protein n=1 Tax=Flavobacterium sp. TaxID=239 RepID=UPI00403377A8
MADKEYNADDISAVSFQEHVRMRPGLYFDECFSERSLDPLPLEAACHAIDEHFDVRCTAIEFGIAPNNFHIRYNAGMFLGETGGMNMAEAIMTQLFACKNHKKHLSVGEEFCKIGIATINAAMEECTLVTVNEGYKGTFTFKAGETVTRNVEDTDESDSTIIYFTPDPIIFGNLQFTLNGVEQRVAKLRPRLPELEIVVKEIK